MSTRVVGDISSAMTTTTTSARMPDNAPRPRLAHIRQWPHFDGFGFNLHAEKSRPGQFVGAVDIGSPAEAAGLKEGDRVVEVNGVNVGHENHRQVVQRIRANPGETRLLVLDAEADRFFREAGVVVTGDLPNVVRLSSDSDEADGPPRRHHHRAHVHVHVNGAVPRRDSAGEDDHRSVGSGHSSAASSTDKVGEANQHDREKRATNLYAGKHIGKRVTLVIGGRGKWLENTCYVAPAGLQAWSCRECRRPTISASPRAGRYKLRALTISVAFWGRSIGGR